MVSEDSFCRQPWAVADGAQEHASCLVASSSGSSTISAVASRPTGVAAGGTTDHGVQARRINVHRIGRGRRDGRRREREGRLNPRTPLSSHATAALGNCVSTEAF